MLSALLGQYLAKKAVQKIIINAVFSGALSLLNRDALNKAMKEVIKELFDLLEYELGLDEDTDTEELIPICRAVDAFLEQEAVQQAIISLLKEPQYQLDATILAQAWQDVQDAPVLPEDFSWQRISKHFSKKAKKIRDSIPELKAIFAQELAAQADKAVADNLGPQPDFDLEIYAKALLEKFGRPGSLALASVDLDGPAYDAVRLWQVFVPQSVRECEKFQPRHLEQPKGEEERPERLRPYFDQQPRPVLEVCADQQLERIVLLGDPGSGKSSLLRFLALEWARDSDPNHRALAPVPLLIELREYHSKRRQGECSDSFLSYLHKAYSLHRFNQNALADLLKSRPGRFLLLLDGLDEIFDRQEREQVISDIHRFSNEYKGVRIIVTSRVVGYEAHRLRDAEFRDFMLQDFDEEQIEEFLKLWHQITFSDQEEVERKRQRLAKAIADSRPIKLLARNPLLLTLMAIINRHEELPKNRFELYEKAAKLLLQNWDTKRHLQDYPGLSAEIDLRAKSAILRKVALYMQTANDKAANLIEGEQLVGLLEEYLHDELRFSQARAAANALVEQLRERNFILCWLGGDSYAFVHRTFLEYFCAAEYVHQFEKKRSLSLDDLLAVYDAHCREDDWQEVLRLICGQLEEHKVDNEWIVEKIIEHLTARVDLEKWDKETPLPELALAVWCLSEVKNINLIDETTGGKLLLKVFDFFFIEEKTDNSYELFVAAKTVGERWPGKNIFQFDGLFPEQKERPYSIYIRWFQLLAHIFRCRQWIEKFINSDDIEIKESCIAIILQHWRDDRTHKMLVNAMQDKDISVRQIAFFSFVEFFLYEKLQGSGIPPDKIDEAVCSLSADIIAHIVRSLSAHITDEAVRSLSAHMGWDITKGSLAEKL